MKTSLVSVYNPTWKGASVIILLIAAAVAQNNPVPQIVGPVHPDAVAPGSGAFTLSVYGANFVLGSVVNWNYQPRVTTYVSGHEIQAQILATDVESNTAGYITVTNPLPGGGSSSASWAQVEVHEPISTVVLDSPAYSYFAFGISIFADFNHDTILDLLGEGPASTINLETGLGNGTFSGPRFAGREYFPDTQVGYGDFNNDGNLDDVVAQGNYRAYDPTVQNLTVMLGNGDGTFSEGPTMPSEDEFYMLLVGDFNRDGNLDLVSEGRLMTVFLGNGDGTFTRGQSSPYKYQAGQWVTGDFNGDGILDIVSMEYDPLTLWYFQGNGDGTFRAPKKIATFPGQGECTGGGFQYGIQVSDFNSDGKLDLAFCNNTSVGVMLGNGDGTFQNPAYYLADNSGYGEFTFAIGDINSDSHPDLLVSEYPFVGNPPPQFVVFLGNGDGTFQSPQITNVTTTQLPEYGITVGDFNSDGLLDFVYQTALGIYVFLNNSQP
jgi:hypothetical protein